MQNKLGFYVEDSKVRWLVESLRDVRPPVILWHRGDRGGLQDIRRGLSPDSFIIGRWYLTNQEQDSMLDSADPAGAGRDLANQILNYDMGYATEEVNGRRLIDAWMSLNESIAGPGSFIHEYPNPSSEKFKLFQRRATAYDALMVAFREQLLTKGIEAVAFNFAAGNFTQPEHYTTWFPNTLKSHIYLGFHEYGWPRLQRETGSGALYYRDCMAAIRAQYGNRHKVIMTEAGLTRAFGNQGPDEGWLFNHEAQKPITEDQYWDSLLWYNTELLRDDYVMGACLYQVGHSGKWASFRHLTSQQDVDEGREIGLMRRIIDLRNLPAPDFQRQEDKKEEKKPDEKKDDDKKKEDEKSEEQIGTDPEALRARAAALSAQLVAGLAAAADLATQAGKVQQQLAAVEQILAGAAAAQTAVAGLLARCQRARDAILARPDAPPTLHSRSAQVVSDLEALQRRLQMAAGLAEALNATKASLSAYLAEAGKAPALQKQITDLEVKVQALQAALAAGPKVPVASQIKLQEPIAVARGQRFAARPEYYRQAGLNGHEGIDYPCKPGTIVRAAADGVVYRCGDSAGPYGIRVVVEHQWGAVKGYTFYAHLQALAAGLQEGQQVAAGDPLGEADSTGKNKNGTPSSSGHHLHFGLGLVGVVNQGYKLASIGNTWFHDPEPYLPKTRSGKRPKGVPDSVCVPDVEPPE